MRGSPCSTHRTAASKVTRVVFISTRSSQLDWEDVGGQVIYLLNGSSLTGSRWLTGGHEINPRVCNMYVGVHAGAHGTLGKSPFSSTFLALPVVSVMGNEDLLSSLPSFFLSFLPAETAAALMK